MLPEVPRKVGFLELWPVGAAKELPGDARNVVKATKLQGLWRCGGKALTEPLRAEAALFKGDGLKLDAHSGSSAERSRLALAPALLGAPDNFQQTPFETPGRGTAAFVSNFKGCFACIALKTALGT